MSGSSTPFGLQPRFHPTGLDRAQAFPAGIASGYASNIFQYSPVILATTGVLTIGTTAADILGAFDGVEYTDSNGRRQFSKMWPANLVASEIVAYVWTDPLIVYEIQANGSLAMTSIGDQADFVNPGTGSTVTGGSSAQISTTLAGAGSQGQLRIVGKSLQPDNDWGDTYTIVQVQIARHQYVSNKVAV
jgi:hypothetical protein